MIELLLLQLAATDIRIVDAPCGHPESMMYAQIIELEDGNSSGQRYQIIECDWVADATSIAESELGAFDAANMVYFVSILPSFELPSHHIVHLGQGEQEATIFSLFLRTSSTRIGSIAIFPDPQIVTLSRALTASEIDEINLHAQSISICNTRPNDEYETDGVSVTFGILLNGTDCSVELQNPTGSIATFGWIIEQLGVGMLEAYSDSIAAGQ